MKEWKLHREDLMTPQEWQKMKAHLNAKAELAELRGTWTAIQDRTVCFFAVWTGLRRAEIAALDVADLHLTNDNPFVVVRHGKGDKFREVLISPQCRAFMKKFLRKREERNPSSPALFIPQRGERYAGDGLYRIFSGACQDAGIPHRSMHKTRHLFGMSLYAATRDLRFVQKQLGHSRSSTTEIYTEILDTVGAENMKKLDTVL